MKKRPPWEELGLAPPPPKRGGGPRSPLPPVDPDRARAAEQTLRSNCARTLHAALLADASEETGLLKGLADAVEAALHARHGAAAHDYKTCARALVAALRRNAQLRERVVGSDLAPAALVALDARGLATSSQRALMEDIDLRNSKAVTLAGAGSVASVTSDYTCERCGGKQCESLDSSRRDIGKCEVWGNKDGQGSSRSVRCLGCGAAWEVEDL